MGKTVGIIDSDNEEGLIAIAKERESSLEVIGGEEYDDCLKKKALFKEMTRNSGRSIKTSYQTLPYLLDYANVSMKEMFALFGIELKWPTKGAEAFYEEIHGIEKNHQIYLLNIIKSIGTSAWYSVQQEDRKMLSNPTRRAIWYIRRKYETGSSAQVAVANNLGDEFAKAWSDKKYYTTVSTKALPPLSENLGVSLHWLMGNDKNCVFLAETPLEEQIISGYLFLTQGEKKIVEEYVRLVKEGD